MSRKQPQKPQQADILPLRDRSTGLGEVAERSEVGGARVGNYKSLFLKLFDKLAPSPSEPRSRSAHLPTA